MTFRLATRDESGQTTVEYILMLAVIVSIFVIVARGIRDSGLGGLLGEGLLREYRAAYELGHPAAKSYDDGPEKHPRLVEGENLRLFMNPNVRRSGG